MRLFVAINLSQADQRKIADATEGLRAASYPLRWLDPDTYHLTLKFLGNVDPLRVTEISERLDRIGAGNGSFTLECKGFGAFPTIRKPRILWLGVDPSPALRCLKQDLEWSLGELGFERETRAFHPHVTLARGTEEGAGAFRGLDEHVARLRHKQRTTVRTIELMQSHLGRDGARYAVVHQSALAPRTT
ncbi:MAG: RNA 2',3'-cyclic phosphodiesterase [Gemmatimonadota bacterium]